MPPTRHSTSTAHKESNQIPSGQNYTLGEYSFRIERSSVPGSSNDKIEAICTKGGKNARKSIQLLSSTQLGGWYVEANETEATVYALVKIPKGSDQHSYSGFGQGPWPQPVSSTSGTVRMPDLIDGIGDLVFEYNGFIAFLVEGEIVRSTLYCSTSQGTGRFGRQIGTPWEMWSNISVSNSFTYDGKTAYYGLAGVGKASPGSGVNTLVSGNDLNNEKAAWVILYGVPSGDTEYDTKEMLVGRFAIELEDAGGVGPESDWIDPGDYDPDWEPDDPTHTLYVTVTGALSGRHNDPIEDPSYSYIPADKETVKDYGCGGDGGHGGGGGAGASTVVIHKFATNQANSKEVTAIARRHGYGSGGGKGGKGGDGCILVYY